MSDPNTPPKSDPASGAASDPAQIRQPNGSPETGGLGEDAGEDDEALAADVSADTAAVLAAEVETLQGQIADLTDRLLRAHADIDNLRKRAEREKQETAQYAITNFAKDTVALVDNFERAVQAVSPEAVEQDPHLKALLDGVTMTEREFLNVLDRHGVKRISPKGEPFDPRLHQAVMERQEPSVANGTVVEVFQPGYVIEDRCLRPAMVVVARGGTKAAPNDATTKEPSDEDASKTHPSDSEAAPSEESGKPDEAKMGPDNDNPAS
ncbi:MAG: nucleotide exchange factor GrpE [Hyphomicrobiaceae bacterium]